MSEPRESARPVRLDRRGVLLSALVVGSAGLVVWTVYLAIALPKRYDANNWGAAWVGLDVMEVIALLATTWAAIKRRVVLVFFATAAATMLLLDAWFDVTTARSGGFLESLLGALIVEIPAALVLYWMAVATLRRATRAWLADERPLGAIEVPPIEGR